MTTLGTTLAATCSTLPGGMFAAGTLGAAPPARPSARTRACLMLDHRAAAPPIPADTTAMASAPTIKSLRENAFGGAGIGGRPGIGPAGPASGAPVPGIRPARFGTAVRRPVVAAAGR